MKLPTNLTPKIIEDAARRSMTTLNNPGFCLSCGNEQDGCEPDARRYECEACREKQVYGAEELFMLMSL